MAQTISYTPISSSLHQNFGYEPGERALQFSETWNFIPLVSSELIKIISIYPALFRKTKNGYELGLMAGFQNRNCLLHPISKKFLLPYLPAVLKQYPYRVLPTANNEKNVLCVYASEKGFAKDKGRLVLNQQGELTPFGDELLRFANQLNVDFARDAKLWKVLEELELFKPLKIQYKDADMQDAMMSSVSTFIIDRDKLNTLPAEALLKLQKNRGFEVIYAHLFSLQWLDRIRVVQQANIELEKDSEQDLSQFFEGDDDGVLKF